MKIKKLLSMTLILTLIFCSASLAKTKSKNNYKADKNKPKSQVVASGVDFINNSNTTGGITMTSATNSSAIAEYRKVLLNNTWNSLRKKADNFAVIDMNQDGIPEVFVGCHDGINYITALMSYSDTGLEIFNPGGWEDCNTEMFVAVNPYDGRIVTERKRGKDTKTLYKFDGKTLNEFDIIHYNSTEAEILQAAQTSFNNLAYLYFVDMTLENIDTYLSGDGKETGILEPWNLLTYNY
ncbi:hypothetical protein [Oribacterium sp. P6A1]|uniref:hypothetical protein n=1 Tax=Oribacterium sp. P6A1 TaxID=1410612 RepID=UPI000564313E|nr:hypothetical protein [Oribacterium sp. P6A1]